MRIPACGYGRARDNTSQSHERVHAHHRPRLPRALTHEPQSRDCKSTHAALNGNARPCIGTGARRGDAARPGSRSIACNTPRVPRHSQGIPAGTRSITGTRTPREQLPPPGVHPCKCFPAIDRETLGQGSPPCRALSIMHNLHPLRFASKPLFPLKGVLLKSKQGCNITPPVPHPPAPSLCTFPQAGAMGVPELPVPRG